MREIIRLLFGQDDGRVAGIAGGGTREEREMAARAESTGRWCASTPETAGLSRITRTAGWAAERRGHRAGGGSGGFLA